MRTHTLKIGAKINIYINIYYIFILEFYAQFSIGMFIFYCNFVIVIVVFADIEKFLKKSCLLPLFFFDFGV